MLTKANKNIENLSNIHLNIDKFASKNVSKSSVPLESRTTLPILVRLPKDDFWVDFKTYLINEKQIQASIRDKLSYAKRFYHVLERKDASSITTLTPDVKSLVMKALGALSHFLGVYDNWLALIKRYNLKRSNGNASITTFKSLFYENGNDIKSMIKWG